MAVCILKYLRTEMHSSPLPRMVNVVVILFSTLFLRVNLNRKNFAFAEGQDEFLLKKNSQSLNTFFSSLARKNIFFVSRRSVKIIRELVSEKTFVLGVHSFWRRANA